MKFHSRFTMTSFFSFLLKAFKVLTSFLNFKVNLNALIIIGKTFIKITLCVCVCMTLIKREKHWCMGPFKKYVTIFCTFLPPPPPRPAPGSPKHVTFCFFK